METANELRNTSVNRLTAQPPTNPSLLFTQSFSVPLNTSRWWFLLTEVGWMLVKGSEKKNGESQKVPKNHYMKKKSWSLVNFAALKPFFKCMYECMYIYILLHCCALFIPFHSIPFHFIAFCFYFSFTF